MMKNPFVRWLLILNLICVAGYGISSFVQWTKTPRRAVPLSKSEVTQGLAGFVRLGKTLPAESVDRLTQLALQTNRTSEITEPDLRFLLSLMTNPPGRYSETADLLILETLRAIKRPTVKQREILTQELGIVLTRSDKDVDPQGEAKMSACSLLGKTLREKSVASLVRPLMTDPRPTVRFYAEQYFKETGQNP